MHRASSTLVLALLLAVWSPRARAADQSAELARQTLIKSAEDAHKRGDHAAALDLAKRAAIIKKSPTLLLFIAEEQGELGAAIDAYATANDCLREAEFESAAKLRGETQRRCRALVAEYEKQVAYVTVGFASPAPDTTLTINGKDVALALAGLPYLVAPGKVTVAARAPGRRPFDAVLDVRAGERLPVAVTLETLVTVDTGAPGSTTMPAASVRADTATPGRSEEPPSLLPKVLLGAGAALVVGGAISWKVAGSRYDSLKEDCASGCNAERRSDGSSSVQTWDRLTTMSLVAGGGLLAAGGVLLLMRPHQSPVEAVAFDPLNRVVGLAGSF
jgi:hypothetical protein